MIYIGTSGWSYPRGEGTWKGYFYPPGTRNELGFYSRLFNCVEINSSFYAPVNPGYAENWARRTPDDFKFTAKLWQKFTHPKMYEEACGKAAVISYEDVKVFEIGLAPIVRTGKLGAILAQFPPGFQNTESGRQTLEAILSTFGKYPLAVELRHKSWSDDPDTARLLSEAGAAWVRIDEPQFNSSISRELPVTSPISYFRFHGRNAKDWWSGSNETRYRYLYSGEEIRELAGRVSAAAEKSRNMFVFFNNHWQGYAPRNAQDLKRVFGQQNRLLE